MNKNVKGALIVVGALAVIGGAYLLLKKKKVHFARMIVKLGGASNFATLLTFDESYLKAWAKALSKGKQTFGYAGKEYNTQGGKVVQSGTTTGTTGGSSTRPDIGVDKTESYTRTSF